MNSSKTFSKRAGLKLFILYLACLLFAGFAWSSRNGAATFGEPLDKNESVAYGDPEKAGPRSSKRIRYSCRRDANCHPGETCRHRVTMLLHTQDVTRGRTAKVSTE
jgi:hypothetical protein